LLRVKCQQHSGRTNQNGRRIKMSLYGNIAAKKKRIKAGSGETMKKAGAKGRPTAANFKQAAKTAKKKPKKKGY